MGLFNHQERINRGQDMKATLSQPVQDIKMQDIKMQDIKMIVEYFDSTVECISITSNLEELQKLVSSSFETGESINFTSATPPFFINHRWVKKITYKTKVRRLP